MRLLGISAFHQDAAAALVVDGVPIAAAQEERFTKKSHDGDFPARAIRSCLEAGQVSGAELDHVVYYQKPLRRFERVLATRLQGFPRSSRAFATDMFLWLGDRLWMKSRIAGDIGVDTSKVAFVHHQESLAAAAFFPAPCDDAALLVVGDGGEWASTSLGRGSGHKIEFLAETHFPHSLGRFTAAMTQFLGFVPGADGGRLEALAAHGEARFREPLDKIVRAGEAGSYTIDTDPFRFPFDDERLYGEELERLLGAARFPGQPLAYKDGDTRHADLAASVQALLEERVLALAVELKKQVDLPDLCFTGELARNRRLVRRLAQDGPFERVHVPVAPGEAGAALGAALAMEHAALVNANGSAPARAAIDAVRLGESIGEQEQEGARPIEDPVVEVIERLGRGEKVAWVHGAMEFADESQGARIVLTDACRAGSRTDLLGAVQQGEPWLPCRLALPRERAEEYIELASIVTEGVVEGLATDALRKAAPDAVQPQGRVWVRLVDRDRDPDLARVLDGVAKESGHPLVLLETFRLRGSPMVRNEADAMDAYGRSELDALVAGTRVYERAATGPSA